MILLQFSFTIICLLQQTKSEALRFDAFFDVTITQVPKLLSFVREKEILSNILIIFSQLIHST